MLWSFAKADITPPMGLWQDGFANRARAADGVLDPLLLRVAAVKSEGGAFIFIAVETLVLTDEWAGAMRRAVAAACGVGRHRVMAAATHTHSAPMSMPTEREEDYEGWWNDVVKKAARAARRAVDTLRPASFDVSSGYARIGVNRRQMTEKGVVVGENPKGVIDRNLRALRVVGEDGKLMGVILQGACHPICMISGNTKYTGDWPGRACRLLEERNDGAVALYFNGGCGDVNPKREEGESDEENLNRTAAVFLEDAEKLLKKPFAPHGGEGVSCADSLLDVPLKRPDRHALSDELDNWRHRMALAPDDSWDKIAGVYFGRFVENVMQRLESGKPLAVNAMLGAVRLAGDVAFLALPFETFSATTRALVKSLRGDGLEKENIFTIGYANGIHGYLPTARAIREGGYEPTVSAWFYNLPYYYGPRAEREVRNRLLALWEETKYPE
jgi:neutral ceramidase